MFYERWEEAYLALLGRLVHQADSGAWEPVQGKGERVVTLLGESLIVDYGGVFQMMRSKRVHFPAVVEELLWMLRGSQNVQELQARGVRIWNEWADEAGNLGPVYGPLWRGKAGGGGDQIRMMLEQVAREVGGAPASRRNLVSIWRPELLDQQRLPPCHYCFQVRTKRVGGLLTLNMVVSMRSSDVFLGLPFNIAQYALLQHLICAAVGKDILVPGDIHFSLADAHLYENLLNPARKHLVQAQKQRESSLDGYGTMKIEGWEGVEDFLAWIDKTAKMERGEWSDRIKLTGYRPAPAIHGKVTV